MITSGGRGRVSPARARRPARIVEGRRTADASCHIRRSGGWVDQMTRPASRRLGGLRGGPAGTRPRPATGADLDKELVGGARGHRPHQPREQAVGSAAVPYDNDVEASTCGEGVRITAPPLESLMSRE